MSDVQIHAAPVPHFIDGGAAGSIDARTFPTVNPATAEVIADVAFAGPEDVDRAVRAAARSFSEGLWRNSAPSARAQVLRRLAALIRERSHEIADIDRQDCGKPITAAEGDVAAAAELLEYFATFPEWLRGHTYADAVGYFTQTRREPVGVVAAIASWNFPFLNAVFRTGAPLATGNSVVLKMAEQTPLSSLMFAQLGHEAGIPAGVLNVVNGDGTTGACMVGHPLVDRVTFAGSTEVGRQILSAAAEGVKLCQLELGGKMPHLVFEDANVPEAAAAVVESAFANSGQVCVAGTRLYVAEAIAEEVLQLVIAKIGALKVGDPASRDVDLGPVVSAEQRDRVEAYVRLGQDEGAHIAVGGTRPTVPGLPNGYFVSPTLFVDAEPEMRIMQEEIFGPVLCFSTFKDSEQAVSLANDTRFGLGAAVWTRDLDTALEMTTRIQAGIVWTNCSGHEVWHASYVGQKLSGMGEDLGEEAIRAFTRLKLSYMTSSGLRK